MRHGLDIDYTILCDPDRKVVRAFGLLNMAEMGGVAFPAAFVIDKDRLVRWRVVETTVRRVHPRDVLPVLRALSSGAMPDAEKPKTRGVFPGTMFMRAGLNAMSRGLSTRWKK